MRHFSPKSPSRPGRLLTTPFPSIFPITRKRRHKQTVLAVAIAASCIASLVPISVSSAQAPSAPGTAPAQPAPANPSPKAESDDKSRQFATIVVPATIQAFFVTDLYAKE